MSLTNNIYFDGGIYRALFVGCKACIWSSITVLDSVEVKRTIYIQHVAWQLTQSIFVPFYFWGKFSFSFASNGRVRIQLQFTVDWQRFEFQLLWNDKQNSLIFIEIIRKIFKFLEIFCPEKTILKYSCQEIAKL